MHQKYKPVLSGLFFIVSQVLSLEYWSCKIYLAWTSNKPTGCSNVLNFWLKEFKRKWVQKLLSYYCDLNESQGHIQTGIKILSLVVSTTYQVENKSFCKRQKASQHYRVFLFFVFAFSKQILVRGLSLEYRLIKTKEHEVHWTTKSQPHTNSIYTDTKLCEIISTKLFAFSLPCDLKSRSESNKPTSKHRAH